MALVTLESISVRIGSLPILDRIDLEVAEGEAVGLAGPNGAGKTSLLLVMATVTRPSDGHGSVLGATLGTSAVRQVRPLIGYSAHDAGLYPELSLGQNLRFFAALTGRDTTAADSVLTQVGLGAAADRRADQSSNGMQRRLDLARLLLLKPRLLLLDEAHAGLDEDSEVLVDELIDRTRNRGGSCVIVSHDRRRLHSRTDRVVTLQAGRVVT